jgi:uncharacterized protein
MVDTKKSLQFILKVVSRCNLNCSYCYMYNKGDNTWKQRPIIMSDVVFTAAIKCIRQYCQQSEQQWVRITFHGGEPCLAEIDRFSNWCQLAKEGLQDIVNVDLQIQTNGTLLDQRWIDLFQTHQVTVGVSIDGPEEIHDYFRVDHNQRGSYQAVERGISLLQNSGIPLRFLSVIQLGADSLKIHRHLVDLGARSIDYLWPDFTHDTIGSVRKLYGSNPCADYLIPIFDDWWTNGTLDLRISLFWNIARLILGGDSQSDLFGNHPFQYVFVETDGSIEGLDVLRVCQEGMTKTGINVLTDGFDRIVDISPLHQSTIFEGMTLPNGCKRCPERETCAGGYLPHRYSHDRKFDNPSVWCADLLKLFSHVRKRLEVSVEETGLRRQVLHEIIDNLSEKESSTTLLSSNS